MLVKGSLCLVQHQVEGICGSLHLLLITSFSELSLVSVIQHVCYPGIIIEILEPWSHHLHPDMIGFTMVDPLVVPRSKSKLHNMFTHG
jgi:hypothetical protein